MKAVAPHTWQRLAAAGPLLLALAAPVHAQDAADPPGRAARVSLVLGTASLLPAGSDVWVADLLNRPLTTGDRLWVERESRAELDLGSSAIRLGDETAVEFLNVDERTLQLKLASGILGLRVRALAPDQIVEIDTPLAALTVLAPGEYRIDLDEVAGLMRVEALSGQIAAIAGRDAASLRGGEQTTYSEQRLAAAEVGPLPPGDAFDQWAAERDRREDRAAAAQYVSRETTGYEDLDDYGSWQAVDTYGPVWVPVVAVGWAPYREGHWVWVAPWGWSWIDAAPWGFAPFHYGRWLFLGNRWCWAPGPRHAAPLYAPALVAWLGAGGPGIGWFPLGWNEVYVPPYRVSERYVRALNLSNLHVSGDYMTSYLASGAGGAGGEARGPLHNVPFRNQGVPGAVTTTTRGAFAAAQAVELHPADIPRESVARLAATTAPPAIVPSAQSVGRRAASLPAADAELWRHPVLVRAPPPPAPLPFEQQRRAVAANGGTAPGVRAGGAPRTDVLRVAAMPAGAATTRRPAGVARAQSEQPAPEARATVPGYRPPAAAREAPAREFERAAPRTAPPREVEREAPRAPPPRAAPHPADPHPRLEPKTGR
jgi:hypothetical protein